MMKQRFLLTVLAAFLCGMAWCEEAPKYSLQKCIEYGLEHSPSLDNSEITVHVRKLETVIQEAAFAFKLTASDSQSAQAGENNLNVTLAKELQNGFSVRTWVTSNRENGKGVTSNTLAAQLSKTILGGGSALETRYPLESAILDELAALNTYHRARRKLAQDIKIAYYGIISAQQSLLVKQRALENAKRTLAMTREREKPLDIITAEIRIPDNELSVNTAQRTIKNGLDNLKRLMGMPLDEPFDITGDFDFQLQNFDLEQDLVWARDNLETFLNNRLSRRKLEWQVRIREDRRFPTVSLNATHYQHGDGDGFNTHGKDEQVFSVNLSWALGRKAELAQLAIARENLAVNQNDYFSLNQDLVTELTNYHRRIQEAAAAVEYREQLCKLQQRKQELYSDRWENGEIDILELVRAQTDLEDALVALVNQKISYLELVANYLYTVGR
ncbi:MAG: TolC family protein [Victivallales bacterium]|nr:TolC family protein [Victivallales bacterium]